MGSSSSKRVPSTGGEEISNQDKPKYLAVRNGVWYFKRKVPIGLEQAFPEVSSDTLWKSLDTKSLDEARKRLPARVQEFEKRCLAAKKKLAGRHARTAASTESSTDHYLLPEHIPIILTRYEHSMLVADDQERRDLGESTAGDPEGRQAALEERRELLETQLMAYKAAAAVREFEVVDELASEILSTDKLLAPPGSLVREALLEDFLRLEIKLLKEQLSRLEGEGGKTPPPSEYPVHPRALTTMQDAVTAWKKSQSRPKTIDTYERFVVEFESVVGRVPIVALGREHVFSYREFLQTKELKRETVKNRIGGLATLYEYAVAEAAAHEMLFGKTNPFASLRLDAFDETPLHEERRPYSLAELNQLFSSPLYRGEVEAAGHTGEALYWAPLIATFTGARLEEIAQMRANNISEVEGVLTFHIWVTEAGQELKTPGSFRRVPVHSELVKCGLVNYLRALPANSMLFPSLRNDNKYEKWSAAVSARFARYLDSIGLTDERLDFHSFRYSFRQQCVNCGIPNEARDALTGHFWAGDRDSGKTYLKNVDRQYPFPALVEAIARLQYAGLNLQHLHRTGPG
jgi:site-specific recombinase XerD